MHVRLAFAVAAHLDPEILLVDEVLAVGDAAFQEKCLGKMGDVARGGRTILFVSHNMAAVRNLCSRVILLDGGQIRTDDTPDSSIRKYLSDIDYSAQSTSTDFSKWEKRPGSGSVRIVGFRALSCSGNGGTPSTGSDAEFAIDYAARENRPLLRLHVVIGIMDALGNRLFACTTSMTSASDFRDLPPHGIIVCRIKKLPLIPGEYKVDLVLKDDVGLADMVDSAASFVVRDSGDSGFIIIPSQRWGHVVVPHEWTWLPEVDQGETDKDSVG